MIDKDEILNRLARDIEELNERAYHARSEIKGMIERVEWEPCEIRLLEAKHEITEMRDLMQQLENRVNARLIEKSAQRCSVNA